MDRNELKVNALLDTLRNDKVQSATEVAELRVNLTLVLQENQELKAEVDRLRVKEREVEELNEKLRVLNEETNVSMADPEPGS